MPLEVALGTSSARVRSVRILKDVVRASHGFQAFCVVAPISPPRLWSLVSGKVIDAYESSLGQEVGVAALQRALGASALALARVQSALIEPNLSLDAQLVSLVVSGDALHMTLSSGMRVYRARHGVPRRLLSRGQRAPGVAHGGLVIATERAAPEDLYVFGSRDAFGLQSMGAMAGLLAHDARTSVNELCDAALGPCRDTGLGAALVVLRVT